MLPNAAVSRIGPENIPYVRADTRFGIRLGSMPLPGGSAGSGLASLTIAHYGRCVIALQDMGPLLPS